MKVNYRITIKTTLFVIVINSIAIYLSYNISYKTNLLESLTKMEIFSLWLLTAIGLVGIEVFNTTPKLILFGVSVSIVMYYVMYFLIGCSLFKDCI